MSYTPKYNIHYPIDTKPWKRWNLSKALTSTTLKNQKKLPYSENEKDLELIGYPIKETPKKKSK
jgi:hypothetical protein